MKKRTQFFCLLKMARPAGVEPTTNCLEGSAFIKIILMRNMFIYS